MLYLSTWAILLHLSRDLNFHANSPVRSNLGVGHDHSPTHLIPYCRCHQSGSDPHPSPPAPGPLAAFGPPARPRLPPGQLASVVPPAPPPVHGLARPRRPARSADAPGSARPPTCPGIGPLARRPARPGAGPTTFPTTHWPVRPRRPACFPSCPLARSTPPARPHPLLPPGPLAFGRPACFPSCLRALSTLPARAPPLQT